MYTIYVISLISETVRREKVKDFFGSIGVHYELIDAIKMDEKPDEWEYSVGEFSCLKSHQYVYANIIEKGHYGLIFEDDFICNDKDRFLRLLEKIKREGLQSIKDVLILGYSKVSELEMKYVHFYNPLVNSKLLNDFRIGDIYAQKKFGALAYIVTPQGADKLLEVNPEKYVADDWPLFDKTIDVKHITPLLFREDFEGLASSLEKDRKNIYNKSKFKLFAKVCVGFIRFYILKHFIRR